MNHDSLPMRPRLAATLAMIPIAVVGWYYLAFYLMPMRVFGTVPLPNRVIETFAKVGPYPPLYFALLVLWWGTVRWTRERQCGVFFTSAATIAIAIQCLWFASELSLLLQGVVGPLILIALAIICYPRRDELTSVAVACPHCGYDLRGQRECRCPECGAEFTLGELMPPGVSRSDPAR